jgi:uncharacterized small protein (DUF1192 family)
MSDVAESKEDRFKRLASKRVNEALKRITLVGKLSNRSTYAYSAEQSEQVIAALRLEVDRIEAKFTKPAGGSTASFQL